MTQVDENQSEVFDSIGDDVIPEKSNNENQPDNSVIVLPRVAINYVVIAIVFFVVGGLTGSFVFPSPQTTELPENFEVIVREAVADAIADSDLVVAAADEGAGQRGAVPGQRYDLTINYEEQPIHGNPDALVTIIEFSDFTCGFCGRFANDTLPTLLEEYDDQVRFVYMDFPFLSQMSVPAALAGSCAEEQGVFWEFHDQVFANQSGLGVDSLLMMAASVGADMDAFQACFDSEENLGSIAADYELGAALGVTGTPAFFINGKFISGAQPIEVFRTEIEAELERVQNTEDVEAS